MSRKGGRNRGKDGGAHDDTHESTTEAEEIESNGLLDAQYLPKSIKDNTAATTICLQDGGVEGNSEGLGLLVSDSDDLESYERSVIENNTEWLKSRCRSLEGVDFDIPTSSHDDILDLEVKEKDMDGGLFEEMDTITGDDGEDTPVIRICGKTGVLSTSALSVSSDRHIQIAPLNTSKDMGNSSNETDGLEMEDLQMDSSDEANKSSEEDFRIPSAILLSAQELESLQGQGYVFDTLGTDTLMDGTTKLMTMSDNQSSLSANSSVITNSAEAKSNELIQQTNTEHGVPTINLTGKLSKPEAMTTVIPSSTGTYVVAQPDPTDSTENSAQPNLTLATISISTDKVANSTQILVNTNQGQQLYLINTADLTQATNALQPLTKPQETSVSNSPVSPVLTPSPSSMMSVNQLPVQLQGTGYLLLPMNSDNNSQGMVLSMGSSSLDRSPSKKIWVCPEEGCNKVFRKLSKLKIHQMRHTGERPYKCSKPGCDWAFTTAYKLKRHEEAHGGRKDFICDFEGCGRKFTTIYNLNSHKKLHERPYTEICPKSTCRQQFTTKRQLDIHMRSHSGVEKNYKCPHEGCNKVFFSKNCMGSHARVHLQDREDLQCKFEGCGKVFDKLCRLKQHTRQHTGEKPYVCQAEGCNWAFATASKLKRHSAKHTGVRKWTCSICLKAFMRAEHLKGHMVTHSGDKPFSCPVDNCLAKFTAKGSLYVHLKRHELHDKKITYHCPIDGCLSHYNNKSSLRSHILKHYLNTPAGGDTSHLDLVPLLTGDDMSDSAIDNLISTSASDSSAPTSISVSIPQLLTDTGSTSLINTGDFINTAVLTDTVMLAAETSSDQSLSSPPSGTTNHIITTLPTTSSNKKSAKTKVTSSSSTDLPAVISRVALENTSGSARTDYRSNHILSDRARKRWHSLRGGNSDTTEIETLQESCDKINSLVLPTLSTDFTSTEISNSQGLLFRDPETGITYVQTQLLQDDPPHPELYSDNLMDTDDSLSLHDNETSVNLGIKPEYTGTTINLQDLE
ncbi:hypothetical protein SNE40_002336 [Patella caerulea]|uniref:C2H2-type domain-containing protein n=1 Tax=Patella caerulea TaxID=87958 RepID=A0AAN8PZS2_PATCE